LGDCLFGAFFQIREVVQILVLLLPTENVKYVLTLKNGLGLVFSQTLLVTLEAVPPQSGANPAIVTYNAVAVKIYNTANIVRFFNN
jgi:hypothetical protein